MSYAMFIENLTPDDEVLVYDTKGGLLTQATVTELDSSGNIVLGDFGGGVSFNVKGDGLSYAKGNKLMPLDQDVYNKLFTSDWIYKSAELEALC